MRPVIFGIVALALSLGCKQSTTESAQDDSVFTITLEGTGDSISNRTVDAELKFMNSEFGLYRGDAQIPIQLHDENANDTPDRIFFQVSLAPGEKQVYEGRLGPATAKPEGEVKLIFQDQDNQDLETWSSSNDGELRFDGLILENRYAAWRLNQAPPYALDPIGKSGRNGSLSTLSELNVQGEYSDLIDEKESLGLAALGVYNFSDMVPLASSESREISVISSGPLVAEVSMIVRGVEVRDEKIDFQIKYRLEVDKPWLEVSMALLSKSDLTLKYGVGLPRHDEAADFIQGKKGITHFAYTYGLQSAEKLHLGNALMVTDRYVLDLYRDDPQNHFYMIDPVKGEISFRVLSVWSGGYQAIADETTFISYVRDQSDEYGSALNVTVTYPELKF